MTSYTAQLTREGPKYWVISIPAIDGVTQARNLREAEAMAKDYIEAVTGVPDQPVTFEFPGLDDAVATVSAERKAAQAHERHAQQAAQQLARQLRDLKVSLNDVGRILGVSHQRAHQILSST